MSLAKLRANLQKDLAFMPQEDGKMKVTNRSLFSGVINTMFMDITEEQVRNWQGGQLIQNAFPNLTPDEREFIQTGAFGNEWENAFPDE